MILEEFISAEKEAQGLLAVEAVERFSEPIPHEQDNHASDLAFVELDSRILSHSYGRRNTKGCGVPIAIFRNYEKSLCLRKYSCSGSMFIEKAGVFHR
jgi:hypothetical protein